MNVWINLPSSRKIQVVAKTIGEVKEKIQEQTNYLTENQRIFYNNNYYEDTKDLEKDLHLPRYSTLLMVYFSNGLNANNLLLRYITSNIEDSRVDIDPNPEIKLFFKRSHPAINVISYRNPIEYIFIKVCDSLVPYEFEKEIEPGGEYFSVVIKPYNPLPPGCPGVVFVSSGSIYEACDMVRTVIPFRDHTLSEKLQGDAFWFFRVKHDQRHITLDTPNGMTAEIVMENKPPFFVCFLKSMVFPISYIKMRIYDHPYSDLSSPSDIVKMCVDVSGMKTTLNLGILLSMPDKFKIYVSTKKKNPIETIEPEAEECTVVATLTLDERLERDKQKAIEEGRLYTIEEEVVVVENQNDGDINRDSSKREREEEIDESKEDDSPSLSKMLRLD